MEKKIRTCIFGGSFNPIHKGHLALGDYIISHGLAHECWFVVSPKNPLKPSADPMDAEKRLLAVKKKLEGHPGCVASDIELHLPIPSYTAQTIRHAIETYPERAFVLLIGGDNLDAFTQWKDYQFLLENMDILVYPRPGYSNKIPHNWKRVRLLDGVLMNVSSTKIRSCCK